MVSQADPPEVAFALPGEWVRVGLDDEAEVAELARLLEGVADDPVSWIASTTALGGVLMMFRIRSEPSVAVLFAWPPGKELGDASLAGLRSRLGADGEVIEHAAGYACIRLDSHVGPDNTEVLTYGVVHPESGCLLLLRVTTFGKPFEAVDLDDYDLCASHLWWDETDA